MSLETVAVIRGSTDQYGDPAAGTEHQVFLCVVAPLATATAGGAVAWSTTDYVLYPPSGADIRQGDRVRLADGSLWKVDGKPFAWSNPFTGGAAGGEVQISMVG